MEPLQALDALQARCSNLPRWDQPCNPQVKQQYPSVSQLDVAVGKSSLQLQLAVVAASEGDAT
jgi:hypothetical protein